MDISELATRQELQDTERRLAKKVDVAERKVDAVDRKIDAAQSTLDRNIDTVQSKLDRKIDALAPNHLITLALAFSGEGGWDSPLLAVQPSPCSPDALGGGHAEVLSAKARRCPR